VRLELLSAALVFEELAAFQPADQVRGHLLAVPRRQLGADGVHERRTHCQVVNGSLGRVLACLRAGVERLREQVLVVEHLDAALAHHRDERVVLPLCLMHPQHVVVQQLVLVVRRQPHQAQLRPVHDHLPQPADLGVDPVCDGHCLPPGQKPSVM